MDDEGLNDAAFLSCAIISPEERTDEKTGLLVASATTPAMRGAATPTTMRGTAAPAGSTSATARATAIRWMTGLRRRTATGRRRIASNARRRAVLPIGGHCRIRSAVGSIPRPVRVVPIAIRVRFLRGKTRRRPLKSGTDTERLQSMDGVAAYGYGRVPVPQRQADYRSTAAAVDRNHGNGPARPRQARR